MTWRKLRTYIEEVRRDESRDTFAEWAQWLAERCEGLHRECRQFQGRWWDTVTLAILSSEWEG